jgi:hypothetical protein
MSLHDNVGRTSRLRVSKEEIDELVLEGTQKFLIRKRPI